LLNLAVLRRFNVVGVDLSPAYGTSGCLLSPRAAALTRFSPAAVESINNKSMRSNEPSVEEFLKSSKNFKATTSLSEGVNHSDTIFILVDTPSTGGER
jgi:hypothetical protein